MSAREGQLFAPPIVRGKRKGWLVRSMDSMERQTHIESGRRRLNLLDNLHGDAELATDSEMLASMLTEQGRRLSCLQLLRYLVLLLPQDELVIA